MSFCLIVSSFIFSIEQADKKSNGYLTHSVVTFLTAAFVMLTTVGLMVSSGAFFPYILEEFQESRASTAAIQSIYYGVGMCPGIKRVNFEPTITKYLLFYPCYRHLPINLSFVVVPIQSRQDRVTGTHFTTMYLERVEHSPDLDVNQDLTIKMLPLIK